MAQGRIPAALVRRWLLRGALVGGAVGAALVIGGPAQAAEPDPAGPVGGLLGGLTTALDGSSGAVLELAAGTVEEVVPAVQGAPVVRDVAVVAELPVTDAVRGVTERTAGAVRDLTTTVDQVSTPVVRPVDGVVVEVVPPPVVGAVPVRDEGVADVRSTASSTASPPVPSRSASVANGSAATESVLLVAAPPPPPVDVREGSSGPTGPTQPTAPWPFEDPATGSGSVSGAGGSAGPDLVARAPGRLASSSDLGGVRPLAPADALAASSAPTPAFCPD